MPALEDQDPAPKWLVLPPERGSLRYPRYATPPDRPRHDPETLVLDVPARPRPFQWTDELSLWGVGIGGVAGFASAMSVGDATAFLVITGLGVVFDVCLTGWRVARELHERSRQQQLGTTNMTFTDEGFRCTSFTGNMASAAWSDVDRVTVGFAGAGLGSVHVWWRLAGTSDDVDIEIGPGADLVSIHRALMRHSAPQLTYVSEREGDAAGDSPDAGSNGHGAN